MSPKPILHLPAVALPAALLVVAAILVTGTAGILAGCGSSGASSQQASPMSMGSMQPAAASSSPAASAANTSGKLGPINPSEQLVSFVDAQAPALPSNLSQRQLKAEGDNGADWLLYGRTYSGWRYSPLTQIDKKNVAGLKPVWTLDTGLHNAFEGSAIVVDGTMYLSTPWNNVLALDAATGKVYWRYVHPFRGHPRLCCDAVNRGVGVGSDKVVMATLDAHVVALDSRTGKLAWDTTMADVNQGYSATLAPQVIGNKVIVGISCGEYGGRGFIDCYDIDTGKRLWRFYTIPGPGQPGHDTWAGDSWKTGGAPNWMTCTYDQATDTIFAGIGNAGPDIDGSKRAGNNLYSTCVLALDLTSGKLKWHYQTVPHDIWDLDCTVHPLIADLKIKGQMRKVVMFTPKNGYFYVLDRTTGKPISATAVADQITWGTVSKTGVAHPDYKMAATTEGTKVAPGASGGKEWSNECYDPVRRTVFIPLVEEPFTHVLVPDSPRYAGEFWWGGYSVQDPAYGHIKAIDPVTGKVKWDYKTGYPQICSITCTRSGLVITGTADQKMLILDSDTGKLLYQFTAVSGWHGNPVVFSVKGKEYICFPNGMGGPPQGAGYAKLAGMTTQNTIYTFALK